MEANRAAERFLVDERAATIERGRLLFYDAEVRSQVAAAVALCAKGDCSSVAWAVLRTGSGRKFALEGWP